MALCLCLYGFLTGFVGLYKVFLGGFVPFSVKQIPPTRIFGHNSLPRGHIGTRIGGNTSNKAPGAP